MGVVTTCSAAGSAGRATAVDPPAGLRSRPQATSALSTTFQMINNKAVFFDMLTGYGTPLHEERGAQR